jgi:hypothetical protein
MNVKLSKYAEDGQLESADDAEFLRRKIGTEDTLDFTGIERVSTAFLDALLLGREPAQVRPLLLRAAGEVATTLDDWCERRRPSAAGAQPAPERIALAGISDEQGRFTPTRLAARLRAQLTQYIEAAYPLSDTTLIKARRRLLQSEEGGRLLAQDPFVETTPRYRGFSGGYDQLGLEPDIAEFLLRMSEPVDGGRALLYPGMYAHQAEALRSFLVEGRDVVVATGTGSGKTECFLVPTLASLRREAMKAPASFARRAVRCLILYPMNALVNDQMARLRLLFGDERLAASFRGLSDGARHPTFGMYTGRTPYPGPRDPLKDEERVKPLLEYYLKLDPETERHLRRLGRYPAKDLRRFLAAEKATVRTVQRGATKGQTRRQHNWRERLLTDPLDRELITRQEMVREEQSGQGAAPDILVTNYSMLEYMLMRPFERPIFEETRRWLEEPGSRFLLVIDEAHMYRGAKGAEVACLIRRLLARLQIIDRPEKLACIITSASLGDGDDAREKARRFAADLTGKQPGDFAVVFGQREAPTQAAPGEPALAETLAGIDLGAIHAGAEVGALRDGLAPLFAHLGARPEGETGDEVMRALWETLRDRPFINQVLRLTAGRAVALERLAESLFPGSDVARRACEVLLTLGTLARPGRDEPGLLPTRVHLMFRGLSGLYACLNPRCGGRQEQPGCAAPLGKLFATPRWHCDACGARVLELASCRDCGAAYVLGYSPVADLSGLSFLWGETEGEMTQVQLLAQAPRRNEGVEEVEIQLSTGCLLPAGGGGIGAAERRSLFIALQKGERSAEFGGCPVCLARQGRIRDFSTKGEQPFTALLETQFAEQPPQTEDVTLPNRGRKVLVFSDGRQKAARLAPALETSHSQDAFRQVLSLAVRELESIGRIGRISDLYAAMLTVCQRRQIDLFPHRDQTEYHDALQLARSLALPRLLDMAAQGQLQAPLAFARALYAELTDPYYSLPAIGMAVVEEDPLLDVLLGDFPEVGLGRREVRVLFRAWLRLQLERRCFLPPGATPGKLIEGYERPEGIRPGKQGDLLPGRFPEYLRMILREPRLWEPVAAWFEAFLQKGTMSFTNDQYYLQPRGLVLRLRYEEGWWRCSTCNRLHPEALQELCYECLGRLVDASSDPDYLDARSGYYRDQVLRALSGRFFAPFGLSTAEHSAQLTGLDDQLAHTKTEKYELRFQDLRVDGEPPIDVLSCTTTMEVGIDIGTLSGVALRNVPPHVANYQQRAGRAGRRGRALASVITYAQGGSHDAYFYEHPERIITGDVRPPVIYVENQKVLERHINAYLVQVFFHETVAADPEIFQLFESLGSVADFLSGEGACSLERLRAWLSGNEDRLKAALRAWVPRYSHGLGQDIPVEETIEAAIPRLLRALEEHLPLAAYQRREALSQVEREALERQMEENLLATLINRAVLPRYAFPTDTVCFWVARPKRAGEPRYQRTFDYQPQRDLQIALSEYAPGSSLTIDKIRFASAALYSPYQPEVRRILERSRSYVACTTCGYVSLKAAAVPLTECPSCRGDKLRQHPFVTPAGFAPDINAGREPDRGGTVTVAGRTSAAKLEVQAAGEWCAGPR